MNTISTPPEQSFGTFELMQTVGDAYQFLFSNIRLVPAVMCLPLLIDIVLRLVLEFSPLQDLSVEQETMAQWPPDGSTLAQMLIRLCLATVQIFSIVLLFTGWYRVHLLGPERARPQYFYPIERRHILALGYSWLIGVLVVLLTAAVALLSFAFLGFEVRFAVPHLLLIPIAFYIYVVLPLRFSYLFPAISVDERYGLQDSWRHTKKQTLKLIGGSILCVLPASTVAGLFGADTSFGISISIGFDAPAPAAFSPFVGEVISYLVGTFNSLVLASFIALAFRSSTGWVSEDPTVSDHFTLDQ